ncbi:hypothetical protein J6590_102388 [Homalodisca vitripennis]|nr:hypothetical protein J6590_102388 [Homalodisca vitripennis]
MGETERLRLENLLKSVEKEEIERAKVLDEKRENFRRLLFSDDDNAQEQDYEDREAPIEREGSENLEDEVELHDSDSRSEVSLEDIEERTEENVTSNESNEQRHSVITIQERTNDEENINNEINNMRQRNIIYRRDNETQWNVHMSEESLRGRIRRHNIIRAERSGVQLPCPKGAARNVKTPLESWKLYFPDEFTEKIVEYTNIWIAKNRNNYNRQRDAR